MSSTIKVIINGALGKMGKTAVHAIARETGLQLVAATTRHDHLENTIKKHRADVVIDFTTPEAVFQNTKTIIDCDARPVIGTTGLTENQIAQLTIAAEKKSLGGIIAPNFSIGAILMMRFAEIAAQHFSDVEIIETHHPQKLDAPSGTAKKTAELISKNRKQKNTSEKNNSTTKPVARGEFYHHVPIHSVRLPGAFSQQSVIFSSAGESLVIQHNAINRDAMMPGLFFCCRKVMVFNTLIYGIEKLL